ncbi:hypothetical protein KW850_31345 [Bacillus sp. sid0103]|uniref:hypothetical protein n=1 Tax=Bacillus sp. sid0103 TaxID=2856337 RepID=UPI001C47F1FB|nr:hypothetical protein [Bacillus sp. sid0103]MBV7509618.1 hypothetical protein [Bacillus sp. sid0103]
MTNKTLKQQLNERIEEIYLEMDKQSELLYRLYDELWDEELGRPRLENNKIIQARELLEKLELEKEQLVEKYWVEDHNEKYGEKIQMLTYEDRFYPNGHVHELEEITDPLQLLHLHFIYSAEDGKRTGGVMFKWEKEIEWKTVADFLIYRYDDGGAQFSSSFEKILKKMANDVESPKSNLLGGIWDGKFKTAEVMVEESRNRLKDQLSSMKQQGK